MLFMRHLLLLSALLLLCSCEKSKPPPARGPATVTTLAVEPADLPVTFEYIATTESSHMVKIAARVSGFLDQRVYTEGDWVEEGQTLFVMDKKPFIAQLDAAKAALARREASMETALLNLERTTPLAALNALSQKDLDNARGAYESAAASVEEARATLETATLNLSYCTITSPIKGISSYALQQDGTYLSLENSQLTTVSALSPIWVNFSLSENQLQHYRNQIAKKILLPPKEHQYQIEVILVDGTSFPFVGTITFMEPYYNATTGTFMIRSSLENPDGTLRPNQYVRVRVKGAIRPSAIAIPQRAVHESAKGHFVWVLDEESRVSIRPVVTGEWSGENWLIDEGLAAGDLVVVDGSVGLKSGELVRRKE